MANLGANGADFVWIVLERNGTGKIRRSRRLTLKVRKCRKSFKEASERKEMVIRRFLSKNAETGG